MRWIILIMIILASVSAAFADDGLKETYRPNERFDLNIHLTNITGDVTGANCSIQIRNSSYNAVLDAKMEERIGGWYNYSYNTSKTGDYFCRQNCTQGTLYAAETCDFVIAGGNQVEIAIIFIMAIVMTFMFIIYRLVQVQAIKYLIMSVAVLTLILTINMGMIMAKDNLPSGIQVLLITNYQIVLWTMEFVMGLGIIFLMGYYLVKWLPSMIKIKGVNK